MIVTIFGCIVSLGVIALSAGGLDSNSGFYTGENRSSFLTTVCHSANLGTGVLQLALCVLSDGICVYYLFYEKSAELYRVKGNKRKRKKKPIVRDNGATRSSAGSEAPLIKQNSKSNKGKQKDKKNKTKNAQPSVSTEDPDLQEDLPITYTNSSRPLSVRLLQKHEQQTLRNPCVRSASFSTFGHRDVPDHVSLIVHSANDNASVAGTNRTQSPDHQREAECHYAQTLLFDSPLPIEEDDELPPYEVIDTHPYTNIQGRRQKRSKSERVPKDNGKAPVRRSKTVPTRAKHGSDNGKRRRSSSTRLENLRFESDIERAHAHSDSDQTLLKHSRSADLLSDGEVDVQGVVRRDFAHSSDRILVCEVQMRHGRPQSAIIREKRLDRRRRALSAEVKLTRDQIMSQGGSLNRTDLRSRTNSFDGSNSSLFASNRILPTKFSLRTPLRQQGMPHVCSPVPVKPIQTSDLVSKPPPKPPRTHRVTAEDLKTEEEVIYADAETVLAEVKSLNEKQKPPNKNAQCEVQVHPVNTRNNAGILSNTSLLGDTTGVKEVLPVDKIKEDEIENKLICNGFVKVHGDLKDTIENVAISAKDIHLEPGPEIKVNPVQAVSLDSGPVVKCVAPKSKENKELVDIHSKAMATIPTSPILKQPNKFTRPQKDIAFNSKRSKTSESTDSKTDLVPKGQDKTDLLKYDDIKKDKQLPTTDEKDVVYAKIDEETENSPGAKVQRARKLLFSFSNHDDKINVFDPSPLEERKEAFGTELVAERIDTIKVQHVTTPAENRNVDNSASDLKPTEQKCLSPSEIILQRKNLNSSLVLGSDNKSKVVTPVSKPSDSYNGARPKTTFKGEPIPLPRSGKQKPEDSNNNNARTVTSSASSVGSPVSSTSSSFSESLSNSNVFTRPKPLPPTRRTGPDSTRNSAPASVTVQPIRSKPPDSFPVRQYSSSVHYREPRDSRTGSQYRPSSQGVSRELPVNIARPQAAGSSNSQGISHLPQSQHARQVTGNVAAQAGVNQNAIPNVQPVQPVQPLNNNNTDPNKPLFSVLL